MNDEGRLTIWQLTTLGLKTTEVKKSQTLFLAAAEESRIKSSSFQY